MKIGNKDVVFHRGFLKAAIRKDKDSEPANGAAPRQGGAALLRLVELRTAHREGTPRAIGARTEGARDEPGDAVREDAPATTGHERAVHDEANGAEGSSRRNARPRVARPLVTPRHVAAEASTSRTARHETVRQEVRQNPSQDADSDIDQALVDELSAEGYGALLRSLDEVDEVRTARTPTPPPPRRNEVASTSSAPLSQATLTPPSEQRHRAATEATSSQQRPVQQSQVSAEQTVSRTETPLASVEVPPFSRRSELRRPAQSVVSHKPAQSTAASVSTESAASNASIASSVSNESVAPPPIPPRSPLRPPVRNATAEPKQTTPSEATASIAVPPSFVPQRSERRRPVTERPQSSGQASLRPVPSVRITEADPNEASETPVHSRQSSTATANLETIREEPASSSLTLTAETSHSPATVSTVSTASAEQSTAASPAAKQKQKQKAPAASTSQQTTTPKTAEPTTTPTATATTTTTPTTKLETLEQSTVASTSKGKEKETPQEPAASTLQQTPTLKPARSTTGAETSNPALKPSTSQPNPTPGPRHSQNLEVPQPTHQPTHQSTIASTSANPARPIAPLPTDLTLASNSSISQFEVGSHEQHEAIAQHAGLIHQFFKNTFDHTALGNTAGWAANLFNATLREGGVTFLATVLRELTGQAVTKGLENASEELKLGVSITVLVGTGLLNGAAMLRQGRDGTGNWITRTAQLANIAALSTAGAVAGKTGTLGDIAPLLVKATAYTLARDGINMFVRLSDNRSEDRAPINFKAMATNMAVFGVNQFVVNMLQGLGVSYSGTSESAQHASVRQAFGHISAFAAANAGGEITDAMLYPAMTAFFDKVGESISQGTRGTVRQGLSGVANLRLGASIHVPVGSELINRVAGHEVVGDLTMDDVKNKVSGAMTARQSLFVILFSLLDSMNKAGQKLPASGHAVVTNLIAGLSVGLMLSSFLSSLSLSPKPGAASTAGDGSQTGQTGQSAFDQASALEAGLAGPRIQEIEDGESVANTRLSESHSQSGGRASPRPSHSIDLP
ncbi:hypothetical protein [Paraburkholderia sp. BCC1886]|uniref:hypothetical protein n=1 Tax=Paraburkholderia sp. BCC1886 TaxID=2562670 RepID=UPI001181D9C7|nr:hypothetical protein [Paraburkholderia sp. BCC1886]